ncbi:glutathione S-transferase family protein [Rhodotorula paludigena]|uniref:glutathione S-transferase family protein n=1 Tax=Rhodotorula paludigena TaxID=86838 RepID=UPI00317F8B6B
MADDKRDITKWASKDGQFRRQASSFRDQIQVGGKFPPEEGRYMLYVSLACPWAHRALIVRKLKGLERFIDVAIVHPYMGNLGWSFCPPVRDSEGGYPKTEGEVGEPDGFPDVTGDPLYGTKFLRELYFKVDPDYSGRFTVPTLWDKKTQTIVNNESSEIIRFFNTEFNSLLEDKYAKVDLYPESGRAEIDDQNKWVYDTVNNGVYKTGFATTQEAYESNIYPLFESLDRLEKMLGDGRKYIANTDELSEADVRLYTTIIRFDPVYVQHFKTNLGTIRHDYPNLNRWLKNLYWNFDAFKSTTNFDHIKANTKSHSQINPTRITPAGPKPDIEPL